MSVDEGRQRHTFSLVFNRFTHSSCTHSLYPPTKIHTFNSFLQQKATSIPLHMSAFIYTNTNIKYAFFILIPLSLIMNEGVHICAQMYTFVHIPITKISTLPRSGKCEKCASPRIGN